MDKKQQDIKSQVRFPFDVLEAIKQLAHQRSLQWRSDLGFTAVH
jgi:hypothetical protein